MDWLAENQLLEKAVKHAGEILGVFGVRTVPVDPFDLAQNEEKRLQVILGDFRGRFDGQLEYHRSRGRFLMFVNTKYDTRLAPGLHHPRTRFSAAHELAHFYLDRHRTYLMKGGQPHGSKNEFTADPNVEREADAFAAGLLMPERLFAPRVNEDPLTLARVEELAADFETSLVSTAIRAILVSHFPCAVIGVRDGWVAWQFLSESLIKAGCYPHPRGLVQSPTALQCWRAFVTGTTVRATNEQYAKFWFQTYERTRLQRLPVTEHFLPVPVMDTLIILLTIPEDELYPNYDD
jgi:hypothetical protein